MHPYDTACAWLVGFLNIGKGILSSNENVLLVGANCSENCIVVQRFIQMLLADIYQIEKDKNISCCHNGKQVKVKFCIGELPNDMKMLSFLGGELSNSAKFFSPFANVSTDNANDVSGTFGRGEGNTWKPWQYTERLKVVKRVEKFKQKVSKQNLAESTKRSKVTSFIAEMGSRQEFEPLLGEIIDRAQVDPLHLKNNACALVHRYLLEEVMMLSNLPNSVKTFSQISRTSPISTFIEILKTKCHLSRLANGIVKWFNETRGDGKPFDYRFTGRDSRGFLHNFMFLISVVEPYAKNAFRQQLVFHALSYICLNLRECVSLFSRINITDNEIFKLKHSCKTFVTLNNLFFRPHPTAWTLGHVVPVHTQEMKSKYGMGLGLNSMEGREAKHIAISRYCSNTNYHGRWEQVFLHEYVSLIWLREKGYNTTKPVTANTLSYEPKRVHEPNFCHCGMEEVQSSKCKYCLHSLRADIVKRVGKAYTGMKVGM